MEWLISSYLGKVNCGNLHVTVEQRALALHKLKDQSEGDEHWGHMQLSLYMCLYLYILRGCSLNMNLTLPLNTALLMLPPGSINMFAPWISSSLDECNSVADCAINAQCLYDSSSQRYKCSCNEGYEGDGLLCTPRGGKESAVMQSLQLGVLLHIASCFPSFTFPFFFPVLALSVISSYFSYEFFFTTVINFCSVFSFISFNFSH